MTDQTPPDNTPIDGDALESRLKSQIRSQKLNDSIDKMGENVQGLAGALQEFFDELSPQDAETAKQFIDDQMTLGDDEAFQQDLNDAIDNHPDSQQ